MSDFTQEVIQANKELFDILQNNKDDSLFEYADEEESIKGAGGDRSLNIDLIAEEIFVDFLHHFGKINSEESGIIGNANNEIILDPIDGSSNISSSFPYFASSVSLKVNNKTEIGIVTNLVNGDYFVKEGTEKYKGSLLKNNYKEKINPIKSPKIGIAEKAYCDPNLVIALKNLNLKFRSPGAIALSLAYAPYVNFVIFSGKHRIYDVDAGLFMCEDFYKMVEDDFILVSKDKGVFENIKRSLGLRAKSLKLKAES